MKNASNKITLLLLIAVVMLFAGCGALHNAAYKGDIKGVERLIAAGADVNAKGIDGNTPLFWAGWKDHEDIARLLIEKGADVDVALSRLAEDSLGRGKGGIAMLKRLEKEHETAKQAEVAAEQSKVAAKIAAKIAAEEAAFTEAAASYRAATVKPTLSEDARKFKVQAEFAVSKKEFEGAAARYKEALDIAPWWPEGHFNRALILGELSRYRDAMKEMKKYLTLVPDAPNARAAQDKIYQWEGELK